MVEVNGEVKLPVLYVNAINELRHFVRIVVPDVNEVSVDVQIACNLAFQHEDVVRVLDCLLDEVACRLELWRGKGTQRQCNHGEDVKHAATSAPLGICL